MLLSLFSVWTTSILLTWSYDLCSSVSLNHLDRMNSYIYIHLTVSCVWSKCLWLVFQINLSSCSRENVFTHVITTGLHSSKYLELHLIWRHHLAKFCKAALCNIPAISNKLIPFLTASIVVMLLVLRELKGLSNNTISVLIHFPEWLAWTIPWNMPGLVPFSCGWSPKVNHQMTKATIHFLTMVW